jgi:hypothetical protein
MALAAIGGAAIAAAPPPDGGTISIETRSAQGSPGTPPAPFVEAISEALAAKGFTILQDTGHAAYAAELTLSRSEAGTGSAKVPSGGAAVMPGAIAGAGAGVIVPFGTGQSKLVALQRIQIEMRIRKRGEDAIIWQGAAVTVRAAGTPKGEDAVVASDLGQALLRSYPAQPVSVVSVP